MSDKSLPSDVDSRLKVLKIAYRQRLVRELDQIDDFLQALRQDPANSQSLRALHEALHKLAGSAGTFGFEQLGRQASLLEEQVSNALAKAEGVAELPGLTDWVAQLRASLQADESRKTGLGVEVLEQEANDDQLSIWLLERDTMLADYIGQQLRSFGFTVLHLRDAQELEQASSCSPDLLLVDHHASESPELKTQPEAFWRDRLKSFNCPIIFTGAEEGFFARLHAVRSGGRGYFTKPLDVPQLAAHVARILKSGESAPERILIVEDDSDMAQFCQVVLQQAGMQVEILDQPQNLLQTASDFDPELILMDLRMPVATGAEMAAILTQIERWAHLPIIYLSAETSAEFRGHALSSGGDAFLEKPVDPKLLVSLCRSRIGRLRELEQAMTRDGLTGLIKHASIKEALQTEWEYVRRHPRPFSVVMLDIDHFKSVNDTHGHAVGDLVIAAVGTLLRQHFRNTDKLGRYGGEEFALVLPDCTASIATGLVDGLRQSFSAIRFMGGGESFSCTLSAGVVDNQSFPRHSAEALIEQADKALYKAKHSGRNRVCLASASDDPKAGPTNKEAR
ncbi:diguanylate cyclase [Saccharospirillum impatiens]|uniref:diguanylate cyclase n=1 Tax=Saccharospirillum impatiens TaxID=169438 RepID=UPI0003FBBEFD|nr:diguanylate cyclase [Saccharospirillum impatiens]